MLSLRDDLGQEVLNPDHEVLIHEPPLQREAHEQILAVACLPATDFPLDQFLHELKFHADVIR